MCKCNNGNPVPSLDSIKNESINYIKNKNLERKDALIITDFIKHILQNGVETNKEYPELTVSGKRRELVG